jgi:hypothetical protein
VGVFGLPFWGGSGGCVGDEGRNEMKTSALCIVWEVEKTVCYLCSMDYNVKMKCIRKTSY